MTRKIIDTYIIKRILQNIIDKGTYNIMGIEYPIDKAVFVSILHKIEELECATPAPEPQDSILDANGWCWDLDLAPTYFIGKFQNGNQQEIYKKPRTFRSSVTGRAWVSVCPITEEEFDYPIPWRPLPEYESVMNNEYYFVEGDNQ